MIEFLELHACSVIIKGRHALQCGTCSNSNTEQQYSTLYTAARQRTNVGFKLAVRDDSGADGLVAPLPCRAYFGKLAKLFECWNLATASVGLVYLYTYHSIARLRTYLARRVH